MKPKYNFRLAFFYPTLISCGPTNQTYYLLSSLVDHGIDVTLYSFSKVGNHCFEIDRFRQAGIKVHIFEINFKGLLSARTNLKNLRPDIVHSTLLTADVFSFFMAYDYPRLITHRTDPFDHINSRGILIGLIMFWASKLISNKSIYSIACSYAISKRLLTRNIKCDSVIQNCIPESFYEINNPIDVSSVNLKNDCLIFLCIGALSPRKNPLLTLKLVYYFANNYNFKIKLIFLGDGPLLNNLIEFNELNKNNNVFVEFHGNVSDIRPFLLNSHLHLSSSSAEGLPNSVLETLSCGIPNFLSNIPEHLEFSSSSRKIISFFNPDDSTDVIAKTLLSFMQSFPLIDKYSYVGIRESFSRTKLVKNYLETYSKIIG